MNKLLFYLDEFRRDQIHKFKIRQDRNKDANVCDDNLDWRNIDWNIVRFHFLKETREFLEAPDDPDELIDIANMAFLLWCQKRFKL